MEKPVLLVFKITGLLEPPVNTGASHKLDSNLNTSTQKLCDLLLSLDSPQLSRVLNRVHITYPSYSKS